MNRASKIVVLLAVTACSRERARASTAGGASLGRGGIGDSAIVVRRLAVETLATAGWPGTYGSLTRDGRYMSGVDLETGNLLVRDMRTGTRRRLTGYGKWTDNVGHNVIAPDGSAIAFVVNAENDSPSAHSELRIIAVDGSNPRMLARTHDPSEYIRPADWSPDNRELAALETRRDKSHEITLVPLDGTPTRILKSLAWRSPEAVKFSPDGRSLAYDAPLSQESTARDLFILQSDGRSESRITDDGTPKFLVGWDASGSGLFFTTRANGAMAVWYAPVSRGRASGPPRLIRSDIWGGDAIGMGGSTLFYAVSNRRDSDYSVAVDLAEGRALASPVSIPAAGIFSPDGGQVAYVRPLDTAGPSDEAIAIHDMATGDERRIRVPIEYIHLLRWNVDGRSMLAFARRRGQLGLFRVDLASGDASLVDPDADGWLQFFPDATTMLFGHPTDAVRAAGPLGGVGNQGKPTVIIVRDLKTRREREVYRGERAPFLLSPDGKTLIIASTTLSEEKRNQLEEYLAAFMSGGAPRVVLWPELVTWKIDLADVAWSPDSRSIVWAQRDASGGREASEIRIASVGATDFRRILSVVGWIRQGLHVSPDGRRVVYVVRPSEKSAELWAMENLQSANSRSVTEKNRALTDGKQATPQQPVVAHRVAVDSGVFNFASGSTASDGRYYTGSDVKTGNLAIRDMRTGERSALTKDASWSDYRFVNKSLLSPDGRTIAFTWSTGTPRFTYDLRTIEIDGSAQRTLVKGVAEDEYIEPTDWSPDGHQLLAVVSRRDKSNQIALVSARDGSIHSLRSLEWRYPRGLAFSPDGKWIAYDLQQSRDNTARELVLLRSDATREATITSDATPKHFIGWSPDGSTLYYAIANRGATGLWALPVRDGRAAGVPVLASADIWGSLNGFHVAGGSVYYSVWLARGGLFQVQIDAEGRIREPSVSIVSGTNASSPLWSPDGQHIAYVRHLEAASGPHRSAVVIRTGISGDEHSLELLLDDLSLERWSADGTALIADGVHHGQRGRYSIDLASGEAKRIEQIGDKEFYSSSPDGNTVFVARYVSGDSAMIVSRNEKTRTETVLHDGHVRTRGVQASPDGRSILFSIRASERTGGKDVGKLVVMPAAGGEMRVMYTLDSPQKLFTGATWSRDGRSIVFTIWRGTHGGDDDYELWRTSVRSGQSEKIMSSREALDDPQLSSDGRTLLYRSSTVFPGNELWVIEGMPGSHQQTRGRKQ